LEKSIENLGNGGRGIGNIVEDLLINTLSRYLFDNSITSDTEINIISIDTESSPPALNCKL
jgi:hypothetical protein